jgi:hypothetical protein
MPYKFETEKMLIPKTHDKRIKLSNSDKIKIKELYGTISQRKLAKMFNVSRRLIIFIGCPEKHLKNLKQRELSGGSKQYYNTKKATLYRQTHRKHKKKLYDKDLLNNNINNKTDNTN